MKMYGSVVNRMAERTLQPVPVVGMGATMQLWSDRVPYTVVEVSKETVTKVLDTEKGEVTRVYPKYIIVTEDKYSIIEGSAQNGSAVYKYETDPSAKPKKFILNGHLYREENKKCVGVDEIGLVYKGTGRTPKKNTALTLGYRDRYFDPHF